MLIVVMGLPGSGKSSVFQYLGDEYGIDVFKEASEDDWPDLVSSRHVTGYFTALTWFRNSRVPDLYKAKSIANSGKKVLVDSYYDKLLHLYIESSGLEWLIPKNDPYYELTKEMVSSDYTNLPDADVVVAFKVDKDTWLDFLKLRGRSLDKEREFIDQCYLAQNSMIEATKKYCVEFDKVYIEIKQELSSPEFIGSKLIELLKNKGIVLNG